MTRRRLADFPVPEQRPLKLFLQIIEPYEDVEVVLLVSDTNLKSLQAETNYRCEWNKALFHRRWYCHTTWPCHSSVCTFLVKSHFLHAHISHAFHCLDCKHPTRSGNRKAQPLGPGIQQRNRSQGDFPLLLYYRTRLLLHQCFPGSSRSRTFLKGRLK